MYLTIRKLVLMAPIALLLLLSLFLGVAWYTDAYAVRLLEKSEVARVSAQPILNLMGLSIGGGNYASVQDEAALNLYRAAPRLRFFLATGLTDNSKSDFGVAFDASTGTVQRTVWNEAHVKDVEEKAAKASAMLKQLPEGDARRARVQSVHDQAATELDAMRRSGSAVRDLMARYTRPDPHLLRHESYLDRRNWLLHVIVPTDNANGGSVWLVFDALDLQTVWIEVLQRIAPAACGGLAFAVLVSLWVAGRITGPLNALTDAITALASKDYSVVVPGEGRRDEFGAIAAAVGVFKDGMVQADRLAAEQEADHIRQMRKNERMDQRTAVFGNAVAISMDALENAACSMRGAADTMSDAAAQTGNLAAHTAHGAEQSGQELGSVTVALEELAMSVREIAHQATESASASRAAAARGRETDASVSRLSKVADEITSIVQLITDIAGKTKMLALNATIEAAHAGEAGKGFAIVAIEVKQLATLTAKATSEISEKVALVRSSTGHAMQTVRDAAMMINNVECTANAIAAAVEQQSVATQEIARSVQEVVNRTNETNGAMQRVSGVAARSSEVGETVLQSAAGVQDTAGVLRAEVQDFLEAMMALRDGDEDRAAA